MEVRFDFNMGARVALPPVEDGIWKVRLRDLDTGNILFEGETKHGTVRSAKQFFVRFGIEVWHEAPTGALTSVVMHEYKATDRDVLIVIPIGTLGDTLAWLPYAVRFAQVHQCRLTIAMSELIMPLVINAYPHIRFVPHEQVTAERLCEQMYATYLIGLFFDDPDFHHQPTDFRQVGLHRTAAYILGVDPAEEAVKIVLTDDSRPIDDPYVCIGVQSSTQTKYWNNPTGWHAIIEFLKRRGYRVICIDQHNVHGRGLLWNHIPHDCEDETGDRPLPERARWLRHAAAFIGLSSGLSWLAWSVGTPVVMISGFTHPTNEFTNPFRVINWHVCNSCWNDVRHRFDHNDFLWCPRHAGTDRQFECTRLITPEQVIGVLKRLPTLPEIIQ